MARLIVPLEKPPPPEKPRRGLSAEPIRTVLRRVDHKEPRVPELEALSWGWGEGEGEGTGLRGAGD